MEPNLICCLPFDNNLIIMTLVTMTSLRKLYTVTAEGGMTGSMVVNIFTAALKCVDIIPRLLIPQSFHGTDTRIWDEISPCISKIFHRPLFQPTLQAIIIDNSLTDKITFPLHIISFTSKIKL